MFLIFSPEWPFREAILSRGRLILGTDREKNIKTLWEVKSLKTILVKNYLFIFISMG